MVDHNSANNNNMDNISNDNNKDYNPVIMQYQQPANENAISASEI